jgi:hypothetical protein
MKTLSLVSLSMLAFAAPISRQAVEPELIQDGVISTARNETWPSIDPVDGSLWFSIYDDNFDRQTILRAPKTGDKWGTPAAVAFSSGASGDRAPRFSTDGKRLYFSSNRNAPSPRNFHIWFVERRASGWSEPAMLPEPVNSSAADRHSSETRDGDLFFSSTRTGANEIYRAKRAGGTWGAVEMLPPTVNAAHRQTDVVVAPDASWMLVVASPGADQLEGVRVRPQHLARRKNALLHEPPSRLGGCVSRSCVGIPELLDARGHQRTRAGPFHQQESSSRGARSFPC